MRQSIVLALAVFVLFQLVLNPKSFAYGDYQQHTKQSECKNGTYNRQRLLIRE